MIRVLHLGQSGEAAWADLQSSYELVSGFQTCYVVSPYSKSRAEIRRRLTALAPALHQIELGPELLAVVEALISSITSVEGRPVLWLEQTEPDDASVRDALVILEEKREWLRAQAPCFVILAGPPELVEHARSTAPELWATHSLVREIRTQPRLAPAAAKIRWLHLSDLQLSAVEPWSDRKILNKLLQDVVTPLADQGLAPDAVVVSGDIAESGQRAEYGQAEAFFGVIAERLGLAPQERWFLVPGNHDIDRHAIEMADQLILGGLTVEGAVRRVLGDAGAMSLLGRRLDQFYAFSERFLGPVRGWRAAQPWRTDICELNGVTVAMLQLSSAWAGGTDAQKNRLLIGEAQAQQALEMAAEALLKVALVHHPLEALRDFDQEGVRVVLGASEGAAFLLHGHLHQGQPALRALEDGRLTEIAAGAVYPRCRHPQTCNLTEVDLGSGQTRVHQFRYSPGQTTWRRDTEGGESDESGVLSIALPPHLRLGDTLVAEETSGADTIPAGLRDSLATRLREIAATVSSTTHIIGPTWDRARVHLPVTKLFVPLQLTPQYAISASDSQEQEDEADPSWSTADLARALLEPVSDDSPPTRAVILGGPGSGKTTLCRFLSALLAGEAALPGVEVPGEPVPLLIRLRNFGTARRIEKNLSMVDYLVDHAGRELAMPAPDELIPELLTVPRAVLLLDGLDEVGTPGERAAIRSQVLKLCRSYPRAPVLITSRIAGYRDAPLAAVGEQGFVHLEIEAFTDNDLKTFVSRWYALQHPDDSETRDRSTADLIATMAARPRLRELARTPLMAVVVALTHRFAAHLPVTRVRLLELLVSTLVETWPARQGRTFSEIDEGLQRLYLEQLALRMLHARVERGRSSIKQDELVSTLVEIFRERQHQDVTPEESETLMRRWVTHLQQGTGLLIEQRLGELSFIHPELMEYLAARGLVRRAGPALAREIAARSDSPGWYAVCLLAAGAHAEDTRFLDELYAETEERARGSRWGLLLHCLGEEALFLPEQRDAILAGAARSILEHRNPDESGQTEAALDQLMRLSRRNGPAARDWYNRQLATACGEDLRAAVAVRWREAENQVPAAIRERPDSKEAARWLLDLWPGAEVGRWAAGVVEPGPSMEWVLDEAPHDLLAIRAISALQSETGHGLAAGISVALGCRTLTVGLAESRELAALAEADRRHGLPIALKVGDVVLSCCASLPALPSGAKEDQRQLFASHFARYYAGSYTTTMASSLGSLLPLYLASELTGEIVETLGAAFVPRLTSELVADVMHELSPTRGKVLANSLATCLGDYLTRSLPQESSGRGFSRQLATDFVTAWEIGLTEKAPMAEIMAGPPDSPGPAAVDRPGVLAAADPEATELATARRLLSAVAAEYLIALTTTVRLGRDQRLLHLLLRSHNRWLLQAWPVIEKQMADAPHPAQLALYLALGWTQQTTTWQWPGSERWLGLLRGEPPEHWLPKLHWHLCWLTHDPEATDHLSGLNVALEEGLADDTYPGAARAMQEALQGG
jgi:predicted phosphodiesterase